MNYLSDRGIQLLYWGPHPEQATLTMENYEKWYDLYLIRPDGTVEKIDWSILERYCRNDESAWHDHAPNPIAVRRLCEERDWWFHEIAKEVMTARFLQPFWRK